MQILRYVGIGIIFASLLIAAKVGSQVNPASKEIVVINNVQEFEYITYGLRDWRTLNKNYTLGAGQQTRHILPKYVGVMVFDKSLEEGLQVGVYYLQSKRTYMITYNPTKKELNITDITDNMMIVSNISN